VEADLAGAGRRRAVAGVVDRRARLTHLVGGRVLVSAVRASLAQAVGRVVLDARAGARDGVTRDVHTLPAGHASHEVAAAAPWYVSTGQTVYVSAPAAENWPGSHAE